MRLALITGGISLVISFLIILNQPPPAKNLKSVYQNNNADQASLYTIKPSDLQLRETSLQWNIDLIHHQSARKLESIADTLGGGVCAFDLNNDNWIDLFFVGGSGQTRHYGKKAWWHKESGNRLLLNHQGKYFSDVTKSAGLDHSIWGMGCTTTDLNNDGNTDLIVTGINAIHLFKNTGKMTFDKISNRDSKIASQGWTMSASAADFNQDGLVDLYFSNFVKYQKNIKTFEQASGYQTTINPAFNPTLYQPLANSLYINQGNFQFSNISKDAGIDQSLGRSLGAKWVDINHDSWPDLVVMNDQNSENQLYLNQQGKKLARTGADYAPFEAAGPRDILSADFDHDGKSEFFMSRASGQAAIFLKQTQDSSQKHYKDKAVSNGIFSTHTLPFSGWGATKGDFNNDGLIDIYVANGLITPDKDSAHVSQAQPNTLYINRGQSLFQRINAKVDNLSPLSSRGVITADLDNDGQLEIIVSNNNNPLQIFQNQSAEKHHWIGLDLLTENRSSDVFGSSIEIITDSLTIYHTVGSRQSYLSQSDRRIHIGLGNLLLTNAQQKIRNDQVSETTPAFPTIKKLIIKWKNGKKSVFPNIAPDHYYRINQTTDSIKPIHENVESNQLKPEQLNKTLLSLSDTARIYLTEILLNVSTVIQSNVQSNDKINEQANKLPDIKNINDIILLNWQQSSNKVKRTVIDSMSDMNSLSPIALTLIRKALDDKDIELKLKAIGLLKHSELEMSVYWLLPLLNSNDEKIQCEAAEAFQFFFEEEEAVTHRKSLAISPLIKLAELNLSKVHDSKKIDHLRINTQKTNTGENARICAVNALAAAESKRAVYPLIQNSISDSSKNVQVASLRALGLIRDTQSIKTIEGLVNDPQTNSQVIAAALIALERLNMSRLNHFFGKAQDNTSDSKLQYFVISFNTLSYLFNSADNIVFKKYILTGWLSRLIADSPEIRQLLINKPDYKALLLAIMKSIEAANLQDKYPFLPTILKHPEESIRTQALNTWQANNTVNKQRQQLKSRRQLALDLLQEDKLKTTLEQCHQLTTQQLLSAKRTWQHPSMKIRHQYTQCTLSFERLAKPEELSNKQIMTLRLIFNAYKNSTDSTEKQTTQYLLNLAQVDAMTAQNQLTRKFQSLLPSQKLTALTVIKRHGLIEDTQQFFWKLLESEQENIEVKLLSAKYLTAGNERAVFDILYKVLLPL